MITYRNLGKYGRLGNSLFQLAATIGIARDKETDVRFPADWIYRPYFSFPDTMFFDLIPDYAHESTEFAEHLDSRARPYLQDVNLFWPYIDEIRPYLYPSALAMDTLSQITLPPMPRLGVHVRRGDNVVDPGVPNKADYHLCPSLDYYLRGMSIFTSDTDLVSTICLSDDVPWCLDNIRADYYGDGTAYLKENEPGYGTVVPQDWIDLFTLATCDYLVISGSTFGVWAAIMANTNRVVRPDRIYGPIVEAYTDCNRIFPPDWKVIPCS